MGGRSGDRGYPITRTPISVVRDGAGEPTSVFAHVLPE